MPAKQKTADIGKLFHWSGNFDKKPENILDNGIVRGNPDVVFWYIRTTGRKDYAINRLRFWIERNKFVRPWDKKKMEQLLVALTGGARRSKRRTNRRFPLRFL